MKFQWLALLLSATTFAWETTAAPISLPIYIEDSHAGSFHWLARQLDLDAAYTLVHFDAHSDASAIFDSDKLRERLRRVGSVEERRDVLDQWRRAGLIQCYNWIEPLMPAPISNVFWVSGATVPTARARKLEEKAIQQLDGHLEAAPRASHSLRGRYRAVGFDQLTKQFKETGPIVVTIDLDYFAEVPASRRAGEFERVWKFVAECRNLHAVTIAISRAYLKDNDEADELVRLALAASLSLPTATIQFEPFASVGPDRSLRAREFQKRKEEVPAFQLSRASETLRALLLANQERISVQTETAAWEKQLADWTKEAPSVRLAVKDHEPSTDNIWRVAAGESAELELQTEPWHAVVGRVEWIALTPEYPRCNLRADRADEIGFASGAPPRPRWREVRLPGRGTALSLDNGRKATATEDFGAMRVKARVEVAGRIRETPAIEIRRVAGTGFRAALTEQFGLPYLFGSGELAAAANTGPETGWGADCANFVVYAFRRQGRFIPWSNPKQLRKYLEPLGQGLRAGEASLTEEDLMGGLIVHLGNHVGAVMEDRPPVGILDSNDRVAHQLEGLPEILSLGQLLATRNAARFDLLRAPPPPDETDLLLGGDVMLGRTVGDQIKSGADPLAGIRQRLDAAFWKAVNLECVVSERGTAAAGKRHALRAPLEAVRILAEAHINAVSLANNHAADFGQEALVDSIARLQASDIATVGAGETAERAYAPHFFTARNGTRVAVIALSDFDAKDANVASSSDRERVARAIAEARAEAAFVLCLVHWGDENTEKVTERQRELARWLIDRNVNAVVGSHSHCIQPLDFYHGRPVVYSLGNLVFDGAPRLPAWNKGELFEVNLGRPGSGDASFRLTPVKLDSGGFPHLLESVGVPAVAGSLAR